VTLVHQATGVAGPYDAVTGQLSAYREVLAEMGVAGGVHAALVAPGAPAGVEPLERLQAATGDVVLVHYSGWVAGMQPLLALRRRTLLVYHNVTPARYFWRLEPRVAVSCERGRERLPAFARAAHVAAGVSRYNAEELRAAGAADPRVVSILLDPAKLGLPADGSGPPGEGPGSAGSGPLILSVGRLAPHKRPDLVIRAFALYQRQREPDARLLCVGPPLNPSYLERLERLVGETGARNVTLAGGVAQAELNAALEHASAFLSLSEHEGFCIPLLEALAAGVPAVARRAGGMPDVGGDAVLWTDGASLGEVAELLHLAVTDEGLRVELRRRAREQAARFAPDRVAADVRALVEDGLG